MRPVSLCICCWVAAWYAVADPVATLSPNAPSGLDLVTVEDGKWEVRTAADREAIGGLPGALYLYLKVSDTAKAALGFDFYLLVDFLDAGLGPVKIEYNAPDNDYAHGESFLLLNSGVWSRALLHVSEAQLQGRQNGGADFRLACNGPLTVSRVALYKTPPDESVPPQKDRIEAARNRWAGSRPKDMCYTFGNDADDSTAPLYRALGVTSIESYVTWETVEGKAKGEWDWSRWDKQVQVLQDNGLQWVPFLILGPAYSTPNWFRASPEHVPCQCLEHGESSKVESLWNPNLPQWIDRFLEAFADRYRNTGVIESVLLGIQGDFGEAIYSVTGGGWTEIIPGPYHQHGGFWCDDPYALADFRAFQRDRYDSLKALNRAWGTDFPSWDAVDYPARKEALEELRKTLPQRPGPERRRWLDFVDWYRASMTRWADGWMKATRKHFPRTPIYLCTGGDAPPEHGSNFAEQCRVSARRRGGVRITNEGSHYAGNFFLTRWVASAGKYYGAYYGFEPASSVDELGQVARIYNATASGASQLHDYIPNATSSAPRLDAVQKHLQYLYRVKKPLVPVALWYPNMHLSLQWGGFPEKVTRLRDYLDFDYVDETMLHRRALNRYRVLVIAHGTVMETRDANRIANWARRGGRIVVLDIPQFISVESTDGPEKKLFGNAPEGRRLRRGGIVRVTGWDALASELEQTLAALKLPVYDLVEDKVYCTQIAKDRFLILNMTPDAKPVSLRTRRGETAVTAAPATITEASIPGSRQ